MKLISTYAVVACCLLAVSLPIKSMEDSSEYKSKAELEQDLEQLKKTRQYWQSLNNNAKNNLTNIQNALTGGPNAKQHRTMWYNYHPGKSDQEYYKSLHDSEQALLKDINKSTAQIQKTDHYIETIEKILDEKPKKDTGKRYSTE